MGFGKDGVLGQYNNHILIGQSAGKHHARNYILHRNGSQNDTPCSKSNITFIIIAQMRLIRYPY